MEDSTGRTSQADSAPKNGYEMLQGRQRRGDAEYFDLDRGYSLCTPEGKIGGVSVDYAGKPHFICFPSTLMKGWWSGGFGYGLWIGILVASGFSVVPVPSFTWKKEFELTGAKNSKDDSRMRASMLFPSLSSSLKRKKDHGRAEALLIAAYGTGLNINSTASPTLEENLP